MHQYKTYIVKLCHIKTAEIFFNKTIKMLPNAMYVCHIEQWIITNLNADKV